MTFSSWPSPIFKQQGKQRERGKKRGLEVFPGQGRGFTERTRCRRRSWSRCRRAARCGWRPPPRPAPTCSRSGGTHGPRPLRTGRLPPGNDGNVAKNADKTRSCLWNHVKIPSFSHSRFFLRGIIHNSQFCGSPPCSAPKFWGDPLCQFGPTACPGGSKLGDSEKCEIFWLKSWLKFLPKSTHDYSEQEHGELLSMGFHPPCPQWDVGSLHSSLRDINGRGLPMG